MSTVLTSLTPFSLACESIDYRKQFAGADPSTSVGLSARMSVFPPSLEAAKMNIGVAGSGLTVIESDQLQVSG
jgi:hypothetical protein